MDSQQEYDYDNLEFDEYDNLDEEEDYDEEVKTTPEGSHQVQNSISRDKFKYFLKNQLYLSANKILKLRKFHFKGLQISKYHAKKSIMPKLKPFKSQKRFKKVKGSIKYILLLDKFILQSHSIVIIQAVADNDDLIGNQLSNYQVSPLMKTLNLLSNKRNLAELFLTFNFKYDKSIQQKIIRIIKSNHRLSGIGIYFQVDYNKIPEEQPHFISNLLEKPNLKRLSYPIFQIENSHIQQIKTKKISLQSLNVGILNNRTYQQPIERFRNLIQNNLSLINVSINFIFKELSPTEFAQIILVFQSLKLLKTLSLNFSLDIQESDKEYPDLNFREFRKLESIKFQIANENESFYGFLNMIKTISSIKSIDLVLVIQNTIDIVNKLTEFCPALIGVQCLKLQILQHKDVSQVRTGELLQELWNMREALAKISTLEELSLKLNSVSRQVEEGIIETSNLPGLIKRLFNLQKVELMDKIQGKNLMRQLERELLNHPMLKQVTLYEGLWLDNLFLKEMKEKKKIVISRF